MSDFNLAFAKTFIIEGGFSDNPHDNGNWTSGIVGKGELNGTKYGISAASYPHLDIKGLTVDGAKNIYKTDWWDKYNYSQITSQELAEKTFDESVNMGPIEAHKLLQRACWSLYGYQFITDDGNLGPKSLSAINSASPSNSLLCAFRSEIAGFYRLLARINENDKESLHGWLARAYGGK